MSPPTNQHPVFYRPDALPVVQPTAPKHWSCIVKIDRHYVINKFACKIIHADDVLRRRGYSDHFFVHFASPQSTDSSLLHFVWSRLVRVSHKNRVAFQSRVRSLLGKQEQQCTCVSEYVRSVLCLLIQRVGVISINVQTDDVSIKSGCVTASQTVHLETTNCPLSAVRFLFFLLTTNYKRMLTLSLTTAEK